jgi:LysM repeat protein
MLATGSVATKPLRQRFVARAALVIACSILAAGCGLAGGGSDKPRAAPTTAAPTTTTAPPSVNYTVKSGDSLSAIANHFGVTVSTLVAGNHLQNQNHLREGQSLVIPPPPPPPPVVLAITPPNAQAGQVFNLDLTGAKPSETITFEIADPSGKTFTGPPHTASATGEVLTYYSTDPGDTSGTYAVNAKGNQGSDTRGTFKIDDITTTTTTIAP